jgi:hypothetical protein
MFKYPKVAMAAVSFVTLPVLGGCIATLQPEPEYVEASTVPANIEIYPHTFYEGRTVYFVNDNWYYRDGPRWAYYRQEPAPLYQHRTYIQHAPPASRRYSAAPAVQTERRAVVPRSRNSHELVAPPAHQVQRQRPHDEREEQAPNKRDQR